MTAAKRRIRRSRPSLWTRIRAFWLLALALAVAAGYGGYRLVTAPVFHLKSLAVTGLVRVDRSEVFERAAIDPRDNVWLLDRAAIRRRIEAIPYVASARVHVAVPANVWLEVTERTAEACVREADGRSFTVDGALRVLERGCSEPAAIRYIVRAKFAAQPGTFLHDPELVLLQRDARALAATGDRYRSFEHDSYGDLEATLSDGIDVEFGDDGDLALKRRLIGPILAELGPRANGVRAVDLRAPAAPVVEYRTALPSPEPAP